jgi:hypothetical protein
LHAPKNNDPQISQTDADLENFESAELAKSADLFLAFPSCLPRPSIEVVGWEKRDGVL